jgi:hypothetical protein
VHVCLPFWFLFAVFSQEPDTYREEIQRAYRERNKQKERSQYLQKERERVKKYYIASSELSRSDRKKTHVIKLISNRKMRERKREVAKNTLVLKFDFPHSALPFVVQCFFFFMCMRFLFYLNDLNSLDCVYHLFFVNGLLCIIF